LSLFEPEAFMRRAPLMFMIPTAFMLAAASASAGDCRDPGRSLYNTGTKAMTVCDGQQPRAIETAPRGGPSP
jgi:hypothetical protein